MKLKYLATIKVNFQDADFWLIRKGCIKKVGKPVKTFHKEHIGVKVDALDILRPDYLFIVMEYIHGQGYWLTYSYGTLRLQHIKIDDVKNLETVQI
jgi:hypothetical protein